MGKVDRVVSEDVVMDNTIHTLRNAYGETLAHPSG